MQEVNGFDMSLGSSLSPTGHFTKKLSLYEGKDTGKKVYHVEDAY